MDPMARRLFIFDEPDRFVAGAVGDPGKRTFYLQARKGGVLVSVALEKAQVAALASRLSDLLDALEVAIPRAPTDAGALDEPLVELFRVGAMALAWDATGERVVIEAQTESEDGEYVEVPDDAPDGPDLLRVRLDGGDARAFARRAQALIVAGRPPCPFCGEPLDPQGHFCPRRDGRMN
jgi:uncharacterized repeat protein (TIGR03847 family)